MPNGLGSVELVDAAGEPLPAETVELFVEEGRPGGVGVDVDGVDGEERCSRAAPAPGGSVNLMSSTFIETSRSKMTNSACET